ncbi:GNAT family N-acetyltransferase [Neisseriaceae bacterium ESL0693]|nr:GNAT family N-acetyltransferase [Neisseriaceae bacterium ESL0693]
MNTLQTTLEINDNRGRFIALAGSKLLGHMDFNLLNEGVIDVYHTFVDPEARGQGVAEALLAALVTYVKQHHLAVAAGCSYVAAKLPQRYPEITLVS